jgi:glycosyltransferase involved in cell wall biosynthesis
VAGLNFLEIENVPPSDMPLWINACSAIILTSEREGSPNIVKEALACGVPVISVDVGDVGKWLIFDKYSKVTSPDIRSLVEALREHDHENPKRERRVDLSEENLEVHAMKLGHIYKKYIS